MPDRNDKFVYPLATKPGVHRDGAELDSPYYQDGVWVRFRDGRPRKMGGYLELANGLDGPIRGLYIHSDHPDHLVYLFSGNGIEVLPVDENGVGGATYARSMPGFVAGDNYTYTWDVLFDTTSGDSTIIVHPGQNLEDPLLANQTTVYYGDVLDSAALASVGETTDGGIVVLQPYLFLYGSNGLLKNSAANNPIDFAGGDSNEVNVAGTKIIRGIPVRGGSNAPSGLFWSADSLIRVSYVGGTAIFRYDPISDSTILCQNCIISVDGVIYWIAIDRFMLYNGVVKELPNMMNAEFFFDSLNWDHRQKIWCVQNARHGEIWWFFPKDDAEECNHAIVFNYREGTWYDTPVFRSAGFPARILRFPVWADSASNDDTGADAYRIYRHEFGHDAVVGEDQVAIPSSFETNYFSFASGGLTGEGTENPNNQTRITRVEPDFAMTGDMTVQVVGRPHAQGEETVGDVKTFSPDTPTVDLPTQKRLMKLRFESNVEGGSYWGGKTLIHIEVGDQRQ